jgi:arsenate reductase
MAKVRVLFICNHNAGRSQISEAILNHYYGDEFEAESAGFEPTAINSLAIEVLKEIGIDISKKASNSVFEYFKQNRFYAFVITVCHESEAEGCPIFPGNVKRLHWSFEDPSKFTGTQVEKLEKARNLRNEIRGKMEEFVKTYHEKILR